MKQLPHRLLTVWPMLLALTMRADAPSESRILLGPGPDPATLTIQAETDQQTWTWEDGALVVTVAPALSTPPATLWLATADGSVWDLSAHGRLRANLINLDTATPLRVTLRAESHGVVSDATPLRVPPRQTTPINLLFSATSQSATGFRLDPTAVTRIGLQVESADKTLRYRFALLEAVGQPGETQPPRPTFSRDEPPLGYLLGGAGATLQPAQVLAGTDTRAALIATPSGENALDLALDGNGESKITLTPAEGFWDLRRSTHLQVTFTNRGETSVTPAFRLQNKNDEETTDEHAALAALAPGASATLTLPYAAREKWRGPSGDLTGPTGRIGTHGSRFNSADVARLVFRFAHPSPGKLRIDSIRAVVLTSPLPDWVGQRPPVPGDWTLTLDENFEGPSLDTTIWEPIGPNWWGEKKLTRYSRDNVTLMDGHARLRLEHRPGWHHDDPATKHQADYATGILRTYGKWTQAYGYFEARMKFPTKTGVWPAFWLMPDRGLAAGEQWQRQSTDNGGMELDVMEHLARWGPYRYSAAMHWDGYGKKHKATGAAVYFKPTPDGWVTSGVLWLPNLLVYYANGEEVARWEHPRVGSIPCELLFTLPIGGWDTTQRALVKRPVDAELPADFLIDYVKVWQRSDLLPNKPE